MSKEKKEEQKPQQEKPNGADVKSSEKFNITGEPPKPKMRQVIIETDGNNINIAKAETAGNLELIALLSTILTKLQQPQR